MNEKKSFWTTLPGILTGLAAVITAIGGLLTFLYHIDVIGPIPTRINPPQHQGPLEKLSEPDNVEKLRNRLNNSIINMATEVYGREEVNNLSNDDFRQLERNIESLRKKISKNKKEIEHMIAYWEKFGDADRDHALKQCKDCYNAAASIARSTELLIPPFVGTSQFERQEDVKKRKSWEITKPEVQYFNINGSWQGVGGQSYIIHQSGSAVTIQEINPILGITAVGQGVIIGQDIDISYTTAIGTVGRARLRISENGQRLTGEFTDLTTGVSMPLVLYR